MAAVTALKEQVDPIRSLAYLRTVVESPADQTAGFALDGIVSLALNRDVAKVDNDRALAVLRELWDTNARVATSARVELCRFAARQQWYDRRRPDCPID